MTFYNLDVTLYLSKLLVNEKIYNTFFSIYNI